MRRTPQRVPDGAPVPREHLSHVRFGFRREPNPHSRPSKRARTSSQDEAASGFSWWSLRRRSNSSRWLCGTGSDSGASTMLSRIASTARSRSDTGSAWISWMGMRGMRTVCAARTGMANAQIRAPTRSAAASRRNKNQRSSRAFSRDPQPLLTEHQSGRVNRRESRRVQPRSREQDLSGALYLTDRRSAAWHDLAPRYWTPGTPRFYNDRYRHSVATSAAMDC